MIRRAVCGLTIGLAGLLAAGEGAAQSRFNHMMGRVTNGLFLRNLSVIRINPLGLFDEFRVGYRHRLFDTPSSGLLLKNTYVAAMATLSASPSFVRPGVAVEFAPLAVLTLSAGAERVQWFKTFDNLQSFPSANADFSPTLLRNNASNGYPTGGWMFTFGATLQARAGDLVARSQFRAVRYALDTQNNDPVFYDSFFDVLAPRDGWVGLNDTDLAYSNPEMGLTVGVRYSAVMPFYDDAAGALRAGEGDRNGPTQRLGPLVAYTFRERRHGWFNAPTLLVLAQWWITHRYRTGDDTPAGLPLIVVGLSFRGDS